MPNLSTLTQSLATSFPGPESSQLISRLLTLSTLPESQSPTSFIYVHDAHNPRMTSDLLRRMFEGLSDLTSPASPGQGQGLGSSSDSGGDVNDVPIIRSAHLNAIAHFTTRLLYDTALNQLAQHEPRWEDGCENWVPEEDVEGKRYNDGVDGFVEGLRALGREIERVVGEAMDNSNTNTRGGANGKSGRGRGRANVNAKGKGKGKGKEDDRTRRVAGGVRMFLVIERAERLKESMPEMIVPLTRLAELSKLDITTIFVSEVHWEDIKPPLGAAIDPFRMVVSPPTAQAVVQRLSSSFPTPSSTSPQNTTPSPYSPSLRPLWSDFISSLVSVLFMYTTDASELAYVAAALWPGFVKPVLEAYEELREEARAARGHANEQTTEPGIDDCEVGAYGDEEVGEEGGEGDLETIAYNARMRLIHYFSPSYTAALNDLYPRLTNALDWSRKNLPERGALDRGGRASAPNSPRKRGEREIDAVKEAVAAGEGVEEEGVCRLPRMSKFVLVAAFVASTNPAKTDMRMFGRGRDERRKGRKKGGGTRKSVGGKAGNAKVPQRLLGPMVFPLDRLLAILGILLEEHDADSRPDLPDLESALSGEYTELELGRVHVLGAISELANMGFLHRASAPEKIDGPPTFRCGISYEAAMALGRDLGVGVRDLMWESY